jgi:hypothetical protein
VTKSNLAAEPPALAYRLVDDPLHYCARIAWESEPTDHKAADLLSGPVDDDEQTERDDAADWLCNYLTDSERGGTAERRQIVQAAKKDGIALRTLERARRRAGVNSERHGFGKGSWWTYDPSAPQSRHSRPRKGVGANGADGGNGQGAP